MATNQKDGIQLEPGFRRSQKEDGTPKFQASPRTPVPVRTQETEGTRRATKRVSAGTREASGPSILYDARGVRVKKSRLSNEFLRTLLFFVLPYIILNAIVFIIVTASPKIEVTIGSTNNYESVPASFTVSCLLPVKEISVTVDSEPVEYEKSGSTYKAEVRKNGTFYVEATAVNGMHAVGYADVSALDDMPPAVNEASCHIEGGILTFTVSDTQSGMDWSSVYAITESGTRVEPSSIDKTSGTVAIQMLEDKMDIHFKDLVGNERTASITATTEQMTVNGPVTE